MDKADPSPAAPVPDLSSSPSCRSRPNVDGPDSFAQSSRQPEGPGHGIVAVPVNSDRHGPGQAAGPDPDALPVGMSPVTTPDPRIPLRVAPGIRDDFPHRFRCSTDQRPAPNESMDRSINPDRQRLRRRFARPPLPASSFFRRSAAQDPGGLERTGTTGRRRVYDESVRPYRPTPSVERSRHGFG